MTTLLHENKQHEAFHTRYHIPKGSPVRVAALFCDACGRTTVSGASKVGDACRIRAVTAPACTARVRSDTQGQDRSKICCSALCCGLQPPGRGGYDANTPCALHCGGHREYCAALTVVTAPAPDLLLPREKVTECSSPVVDHPALPVQPCSAPRRVQTQWIWCC